MLLCKSGERTGSALLCCACAGIFVLFCFSLSVSAGHLTSYAPCAAGVAHMGRCIITTVLLPDAAVSMNCCCHHVDLGVPVLHCSGSCHARSGAVLGCLCATCRRGLCCYCTGSFWWGGGREATVILLAGHAGACVCKGEGNVACAQHRLRCVVDVPVCALGTHACKPSGIAFNVGGPVTRMLAQLAFAALFMCVLLIALPLAALLLLYLIFVMPLH